MIMPMAGLSIRGALFYQGENNSFGDTWIPFQQTFPAVIADWRKLFRDEQLPFGIIQIAGWSTRRSMTYDMNHHTNVVREVQFNTWRSTPGTRPDRQLRRQQQRLDPPRPQGTRWASARRAGRCRRSTASPTRCAEGPLQWHGPVYQSMEKHGRQDRRCASRNSARMACGWTRPTPAGSTSPAPIAFSTTPRRG